MGDSPLYFRTAGKRLCLGGGALALLALVGTALVGRFLLMTLLAPLPMVAFGLGMLVAPGDARSGEGVTWEKAWTATRLPTRLVWLGTLTVGIALDMVLLMVVVPVTTLDQ